jgi:uncharacterized protein (UPF0335 family)
MGGSEINMETLEQLFAQVQKIEGMESEQKELARDLEILKNEIKKLRNPCLMNRLFIPGKKRT